MQDKSMNEFERKLIGRNIHFLRWIDKTIKEIREQDMKYQALAYEESYALIQDYANEGTVAGRFDPDVDKAKLYGDAKLLEITGNLTSRIDKRTRKKGVKITEKCKKILNEDEE